MCRSAISRWQAHMHFRLHGLQHEGQPALQSVKGRVEYSAVPLSGALARSHLVASAAFVPSCVECITALFGRPNSPQNHFSNEEQWQLFFGAGSKVCWRCCCVAVMSTHRMLRVAGTQTFRMSHQWWNFSCVLPQSWQASSHNAWRPPQTYCSCKIFNFYFVNYFWLRSTKKFALMYLAQHIWCILCMLRWHQCVLTQCWYNTGTRMQHASITNLIAERIYAIRLPTWSQKHLG